MANTKKLTLAGIAMMILLLSPGFAQADYGNNTLWETEVIDEIVVVGRKRSGGLSRIFSIEPVLKKLRRFDMELFPGFVPQPVGQSFGLSLLRGSTEQVGLIEVFRVRFGYRGS